MKPPAIAPSDVLSYHEMCAGENARLRRGMNFRLRGGLSVVLMSELPDAPYADALEDSGRTLIYEGHNAPLSVDCPHPDEEDQPARTSSGRLTQNGLFHEAAERFKRREEVAEPVKVYQKLREGQWVCNGLFRLTDAWQAPKEGRRVWKFRLELVDDAPAMPIALEVWRRDGGKCAECGGDFHLRFAPLVASSDGAPIEDAAHVRLLCERCGGKHSLGSV